LAKVVFFFSGFAVAAIAGLAGVAVVVSVFVGPCSSFDAN
jgi:hypothetical protein